VDVLLFDVADDPVQLAVGLAPVDQDLAGDLAAGLTSRQYVQQSRLARTGRALSSSPVLVALRFIALSVVRTMRASIMPGLMYPETSCRSCSSFFLSLSRTNTE
jgi:hypothetical protein